MSDDDLDADPYAAPADDAMTEGVDEGCEAEPEMVAMLSSIAPQSDHILQALDMKAPADISAILSNAPEQEAAELDALVSSMAEDVSADENAAAVEALDAAVAELAEAEPDACADDFDAHIAEMAAEADAPALLDGMQTWFEERGGVEAVMETMREGFEQAGESEAARALADAEVKTVDELQELVEQRTQMFDMLRSIVEKYDAAAKGVINGLGR